MELASWGFFQGLSLLSYAVGIIFLWYGQKKRAQAAQLFSEAETQLKHIKKDVEVERREAALKLKDELHKRKTEFDLEMKKERLELERIQSKLHAKSDNLDKKEQRLDDLGQELQHKERTLLRLGDKLRVDENKIKTVYTELITKLENISGMTRDEARQQLSDLIQNEVRLANEKWIQKVEEETRTIAKERSISLVVNAMQRYTADQVAAHSSGVVTLPNEEMKGRIIGKEGRNIKALEMSTGMEFIIDAPQAITISGFNPIRREIAKRTLERLIADGRINPTRIEEMVGRCEQELEDMIEEHGKQMVLEFNLQGVHQEIVTLLGKLYFRTSFSQNVLSHSREVGMFARMIADELGLDGGLALRCGLLHDIGKAVTAEIEGPHALIGAEIAKRCGEDPRVVNAIAAHHEEEPFTSIYGPLVVIADAISAVRPGARQETLTTYLKRIEKLEAVALSFDGIKKAFALQAGREVRVIVEEEFCDDDKAAMLARDIARKVEQEMTFPGQIKINVIREKRSIEYAR